MKVIKITITGPTLPDVEVKECIPKEQKAVSKRLQKLVKKLQGKQKDESNELTK